MWVTFAPPIEWALDVATAFALFLILGRRWALSRFGRRSHSRHGHLPRLGSGRALDHHLRRNKEACKTLIAYSGLLIPLILLNTPKIVILSEAKNLSVDFAANQERFFASLRTTVCRLLLGGFR